MKIYLASILFFLSFGIPQIHAANADLSPVIQKKDTLPKVFMLGEYEKKFDELTLEHQTLLLTACSDDMDLAFSKWISMAQEMEAYANLVKYDLDGVKMWLNVFWNKNGSIKHIAYFLKPNSKNVDTIKLTKFLGEFMAHYRFPLTFEEKFSHYGTANFPMIPKRVKKEKKPVANTKESSDDNKSGMK